ncbi:hypothetical protein, partial [Lacticaseibacillus nasuensis]|uniref:hypothetical protein n=1 Tax=Lacticaseibacillus nasuensis TaxID=944671 RepID=UPI001CDA87D7
RAAVAAALSEQAQAAGFTPLSPRYAPFEVTDWWQRGGETHFDVAMWPMPPRANTWATWPRCPNKKRAALRRA